MTRRSVAALVASRVDSQVQIVHELQLAEVLTHCLNDLKMASTLNAFDLLKGAESTLQQKKKKKNKAKKPVDAAPVVDTVAETQSEEQIVEQVGCGSFSLSRGGLYVSF